MKIYNLIQSIFINFTS